MTTLFRTRFKIENGIPRPYTGTTYPFGEMRIDDSFAVPKEFVDRVRAAALRYGRPRDLKFVVRLVSETEPQYRCWRTK